MRWCRIKVIDFLKQNIEQYFDLRERGRRKGETRVLFYDFHNLYFSLHVIRMI
jgi:hypothetical protein